MNLEIELDELLGIKTTGRDASNANYLNFPYEATPYQVLENIVNSGYISKKDRIIDFGCGKGRVSFYLEYFTKSNVIGVEYDLRLYNRAIENKKIAVKGNKVDFVNENAELFLIPEDVTGCYFFNPFSVTILEKVIDNLRKSIINNKRNIKLFFYYPSKEYLTFLDGCNDIALIDIIDCRDLFIEFDEKEIVKIYQM